MHKMRRILAILTVATLMLAAIAGCSSVKPQTTAAPASSALAATTEAAQSTPTPDANQIDVSKHLDLIMYLMGDPPPDTQLVVDELNKLFAKDLNASLKINNISWADWASKYNLVLASGENVDMIYTANWDQYGDQVKKGAFMALNDLLPKYAPMTWEKTPQTSWKLATLDGKIFAIPSVEKLFDTHGIEYRGDLLKKYNLPEITSMETLEAYLDAVKANDPQMIPFNAGNSESYLFSETYPLFLAKNKLFYAVQGDIGYLVTAAAQTDISDIKFVGDMPEFLAFCKDMQRWQQKGFWSKSVLSNKVQSHEQFAQGNSAAADYHILSLSVDFSKLVSAVQGADPQFFCYGEYGDIPYPTSAQQNMMAIPKVSKNPERALMVMDKLKWDKGYYDLLQYGILNKHYAIDAQGARIDPPGIAADQIGYSGEKEGAWAFRNNDLKLVDKSQWSGVAVIDAKLDSFNRVNKSDAFVLDKSQIQTECVALEQVASMYMPMLEFGMADDVDATMKEFVQKMKDAGLDKVMTEVQKQLAAYKQAQGY
jgi:putative aldouronate transport system substrate-binding protein